MSEQRRFMEKVLQLEQQAKENGSVISPEEIRDAFPRPGISEEQFEEILRYFEARQIRIKGRDHEGEVNPEDRKIQTKETKRDQDMVRLYMEEMKSAFQLEEGQEEDLLVRLASGDGEARDLLVEAYLPMAAGIADAYRGKGLLHSDLIQECNLGLLIAVSAYGADQEGAGLNGPAFREYLEESICSHVEDQLSEYTHSMRSARKMVRQMNRLNDAATAFAKEYGREASPLELAERVELSEDEVRRLMKSSLDAIHLLETGRFED